MLRKINEKKQEIVINESLEEYVIILDIIANKKKPEMQIYQAFGEELYGFFEVIGKIGTKCEPFDTVYIGKGERDKIHHISGILPIEKLTPNAITNLRNYFHSSYIYKYIAIRYNLQRFQFLRKSKWNEKYILVYEKTILPGLRRSIKKEIEKLFGIEIEIRSPEGIFLQTMREKGKYYQH